VWVLLAATLTEIQFSRLGVGLVHDQKWDSMDGKQELLWSYTCTRPGYGIGRDSDEPGSFCISIESVDAG
jgi:hypothetical protein